jgi:L-Ala-D/L-Glu epimerase / N-acetyl-D-glutamate racemase
MRDVIFKVEPWKLKIPFNITGYRFTAITVLLVEIFEHGKVGRGEATGVYYLGEDGESMLAQANSIKKDLEDGVERQQLSELLPAGGARNAIDCALWDLECKLSAKSIWQLTGISPSTVMTVNTVGVDKPGVMVEIAKACDTKKIKVKLDGEHPLEKITAVCSARPDAEIVVDVNQGWSFEQLEELAPAFKALGVKMIEQPLARGNDALLQTYDAPLTLCGDESCLDSNELAEASQRYSMVNIKLDKTGGLTEALKLAGMAKERGLGLMVGNMVGTSLAMAPAFVIAQLCDFVDLDGAVLLARDRENAMSYSGGVVSIPNPLLWG